MRVGALGLVTLCMACETPPYPKPVITGVEPPSWPHQPTISTPIEVQGDRFYYALPMDQARPDLRFRARIGDVVIRDVEWLDNTRLVVNVPGSIPPDTYDITVHTPTGQRDTLEGGVTILEPDGWWNEDWEQRNWITADNSMRDEDLVNFPVLVVLDDTFPYASTRLDGADLRVIDEAFNELAYEIEQWNDDGDSFVWVRLPRVPAHSTARFWIYSGNPDAANGTSTRAVWSANYTGVWHLGESTPPFRDSTSHDVNATIRGAVETSIPGFIGHGVELEGPTEALLQFADPPRQANEPFTIELWFELVQMEPGEWVALLDKGRAGNTSWHSIYVLPGGNLGGGWSSYSGQGGNLNGTALSLRSWTHAALTFDGTNATLFRNGDTELGPVPRHYSNIDLSTVAGSDLTDGNPYVAAVLDEIRFSSIARSAAWLDAQHASMSGTMLNYGPFEPRP